MRWRNFFSDLCCCQLWKSKTYFFPSHEVSIYSGIPTSSFFMRRKCVQCQIWKAKCSESGFNPPSQWLIAIPLKVHVKMFTDFGGVWIRPWGLDLYGWTLGTLLRSSSFLKVPSLVCWVLTFPLIGLLPTGVSGSVTSAQLVLPPGVAPWAMAWKTFKAQFSPWPFSYMDCSALLHSCVADVSPSSVSSLVLEEG